MYDIYVYIYIYIYNHIINCCVLSIDIIIITYIHIPI